LYNESTANRSNGVWAEGKADSYLTDCHLIIIPIQSNPIFV